MTELCKLRFINDSSQSRIGYHAACIIELNLYILYYITNYLHVLHSNNWLIIYADTRVIVNLHALFIII